MMGKDLVARAKTTPQLAELILSQMDDFVYIVDQEYRVAFLNNTPHFLQSDDIAGKCCYETIMGQSHPCSFCPLTRLLSGQESCVTQVFARGDRQYQVTISPLFCGESPPLCLHVMRDITEIKRKEEWLEAERQLLHSRFKAREYPYTPVVDLEDLIGMSPKWLAVKGLIRELAHFPEVTVLVVGETGTGKEVVAQALHRITYGERAPFVPFNCSAIPEHLLESELFGYERGAFTGANSMKKGLFELADGGTLFLDEIGELSLAVQPKLLRVLETKSFSRLGSTRRIGIDCRILCATNKPLWAMVTEGKFRADLFHRLNTFTITLPPLRERCEDIPLFIDAFIAQANRRLGKRVQGISAEALALLQAYPWPGNVRELKNVIERAVILTETTRQIEKTVFPPEMFPPFADEETTMLSLREMEKQYLVKTLTCCRGNKSWAAKVLRISRTTLRKKLQDNNLL